MQLDKTHVVIRVRTLAEIGDLALVMIRRYPQALLVGFVLGALPWIIANALLLYWIPLTERQYGLFDEASNAELLRYCGWMALLVFLQTPAAGALMTKYIGEAVFEQELTWSHIFREIRKNFWSLFYVLCIRRLPIPVMILVAMRWQSVADPFMDAVLPIGILVFAAIFRSSKPFTPEILILEQCQVWEKDKHAITAASRANALHSPISSDLTGRFCSVSFLGIWLFMSILYTLVAVRGFLTGNWSWDLFMLLVMYPLSLWMVGAVCVLIRYLNYLDARIRLEGWEVELAIRAETMRQFGEEGIALPRPTKTQTNVEAPKTPVEEPVSPDLTGAVK